jgi:hypothetical protein
MDAFADACAHPPAQSSSLYPALAPLDFIQHSIRIIAKLLDINRILAGLLLVIAFVSVRRHLSSEMVRTRSAHTMRPWRNES